MVGAVRFELTTSCTRNKRASQATLRPDKGGENADWTAQLQPRSWRIPPRYLAGKHQAPRSKHQIRTNLQSPRDRLDAVARRRNSSKTALARPTKSRRSLELGYLELFWILVLGVWIFRWREPFSAIATES